MFLEEFQKNRRHCESGLLYYDEGTVGSGATGVNFGTQLLEIVCAVE